MLLRGAYDATIQALYILHSPSAADRLGQQYLDYQWIERHNLFQIANESPTKFGKRLMSGPTRAKNGPAVEAEIATFLPRFGGKKPWRTWYGPDLDLAKMAIAAGYESEYRLFQKMFSGIVHSSSLYLIDRIRPLSELYETMAFRLFMRVLGRFAEYQGTDLSDFDRKLLAESYENMMDIG